MEEIFDCIVIGAGQTGLSCGYNLQKAGLNYLILEANDKVVGSFGSYYDSLILISPLAHAQLPGFKLKGDRDYYPTRDEYIQYLQEYYKNLKIRVQTSTRVVSVEKTDEGFQLETDGKPFFSRALIDASGPFNHPVIPHYPGQNNFKGQIIHSFNYKNPSSITGNRVVVVGRGSSAVQIAYDLKDKAQVTLTSKKPIKWISQRPLGMDIHWWMHLSGVDHLPIKKLPKNGLPVPDRGYYKKALDAGAFNWKPMFTGFTENGVTWADGTKENIDSVVYATGYKPNPSWLSGLGVFDAEGNLKYKEGVSTHVPGLFFAGFALQRNSASGNARGTAFDAEFIVKRVLHYLGKNPKPVWLDSLVVRFRQLFRIMD